MYEKKLIVNLESQNFTVHICNDNKKIIFNYVNCICIIATTYKVRKLNFTLPVEPFFRLLEYGEIE